MGECIMDHLLKVFHLRCLIGLVQFAQLTMGFNIDIRHPTIFVGTEARSHFGHRVCQFGPAQGESILVTAPLQANGTGMVFKCSYHSKHCEALPVQVDPDIAFGLSLACNADRAMVCGPHLAHGCDSLNYLNGLCVELGPELAVLQKLKPAFQECSDFGLDAVILFDSSHSIIQRDFETMISFIKNIIRMFTPPRAQVAVAQYSTGSNAVFHFENFAVDPNADNLMSSVNHQQGETHTPSAIRFVLEKMMREDRGMRKNSRKMLVVITDGKSNDLKDTFDTVIPLAERMGVTRFAIGVGKEVSFQELVQIASSPEVVFEISNFEALNSIQNQLREKIFNIEGTNSNSSSFEKELSQGGFSVTLSGDVSLFGAVGAYSWSGGIEEIAWGANATFINASALERDMEDSYLGYSVAVAEMENGSLYFAGAPRYNHTGLVLAFQKDPLHGPWAVTHRIHGSQLGSYFGAELCVLNVFGEGHAGLLLIGAPLYHAQGVGGEVRVCTLETGAPNCSLSLHGAHGNVNGRFGASLSPCPDLNGDGVPELAVGAPMENKGQGSVYIFLGRIGGIQTKYSQRVQMVNGGSGLQHFGVSVHSSGDLSSDGLADLVVGAKGSAVILRSQPVMHVLVSVTLDPPIILQDVFHCAGPFLLNTPVSTVILCVTVQGTHMGNIQAFLQASVSMSVKLDAQIPARLLFYPSSESSHWAETVTGTACHNLSISIPTCISDYHALPLSGQLSVKGLEIPGTGGLKSVLSPDNPTSFTHMILLEKVCGEDHVCVSDLQVSVNFTSPKVVRSPGFPVELSVEVANSGEDASGTELTVVHPSSLTFVRAKQSSGQVAVYCVSNTTGPESLTHTVCSLSSKVLRQGAQVAVLMSFTLSDLLSLTDRLDVNVSVISNNEELDNLQDNFASSSVAVKLPINIIVKNGDSTQYISFPDQNMLEHIYMVENIGYDAAPVNVTFVVPVEMDSGYLWNVSLPETKNSRGKCVREDVFSKKDNSTPFSQHCSGAICHLIGCTIEMLTSSQPTIFKFLGNISRKAEGSKAQVEVVSWGTLSFDRSIYSQYPANSFQSLTIVSILNTPSQARTTLIISLTVFCSLLVLVIVSWVLYKAGFFKSREPPSGGRDETAPAPTAADNTSLKETIL